MLRIWKGVRVYKVFHEIIRIECNNLPNVVVPLPNSSISTSECTLACFMIIDVSASSTKNVDSRSKILSAAPEMFIDC